MTVFLDVTELESIKSVGISDNDKPFSWDNDVKMEVVKKDSLHKKTFERNTERLCSEIKFTVNDKFELKDNENQKKILF